MGEQKLLIVEDNRFTQIAITKIMELHYPDVEIVEIVETVAEGIKAIEQHQPDILLMDVELPDGRSFDILQEKKFYGKLIFMSTHHEFALKAIQYSAIDFICKPFDVHEFVWAFEKAIDNDMDPSYQKRIETLFKNMEEGTASQLVILGDQEDKTCHIDNIPWAKAVVGGSEFFFSDGSSFFSPIPLRHYEMMLSSAHFFRCHPHHIVNIKKIKLIEPIKNKLILDNNIEINIENRRIQHLQKKLELLSCV